MQTDFGKAIDNLNGMLQTEPKFPNKLIVKRWRNIKPLSIELLKKYWQRVTWDKPMIDLIRTNFRPVKNVSVNLRTSQGGMILRQNEHKVHGVARIGSDRRLSLADREIRIAACL